MYKAIWDYKTHKFTTIYIVVVVVVVVERGGHAYMYVCIFGVSDGVELYRLSQL